MGKPHDSEQLARMFRALMHPARLEILETLRNEEQCVCHIEAHLGYRQAYISQHLTVLREAGLVGDRRDGWNIYYRVIEPQVYGLIDQARAMFGMNSDTSPAENQTAVCPCPKCAATRSKTHERPSLSMP